MTPKRTLTVVAVLFSLLLSTLSSHAFLTSIEESEIEVQGNPHQRQRTGAAKDVCNNDSDTNSGTMATCEPRSLLSPHLLLLQPMLTQPDTFLGIVRRKVLSVPVPVYQFKQPSRVSHLELPFEIVLVSDLMDAAAATLRDVPVDSKVALDSWFPGYAWTPVVCNGGCSTGYIHVGWRFTSTSNPGEYFYALIVDTTRKGTEKVAAGVSEKGIIAGTISDVMHIGTAAPGWMVAALAFVK